MQFYYLRRIRNSMLRIFFSTILLFPLTSGVAHAQERLNKDDFKCFDKGAYASFDFLETTRSYGNYEPEEEWSQKITSGQIVRKSVEMEGGHQYTILLATENGAEATAIEIRDDTGMQLDYTYKINELDKDQINLFFTPDGDGTYLLYFSVVNPKQSSSCTYMAVLKGDIDPEYNEGKIKEDQ